MTQGNGPTHRPSTSSTS